MLFRVFCFHRKEINFQLWTAKRSVFFALFTCANVRGLRREHSRVSEGMREKDLEETASRGRNSRAKMHAFSVSMPRVFVLATLHDPDEKRLFCCPQS